MYNNYRRPYHNRHDNMPHTLHYENDHPTVDSSRFWHLLKQLRRQQQVAKKRFAAQSIAKSQS